jgi:FMN-dependent NADH-azoreductase
MSKVLLIRSSIFGEDSKSTASLREFLAHYPRSLFVELVLTPASARK